MGKPQPQYCIKDNWETRLNLNISKEHSVYAPSQRATMLHCDITSHWLYAYAKWSWYNSLFWVHLTYWGWVTHKCISKVNIICSDNGLSPGRRHAIIQTNAGILLIWPLGTNISGISIKIHAFSFKKMHLKMSSVKWLSFCLGFNVLNS